MQRLHRCGIVNGFLSLEIDGSNVTLAGKSNPPDGYIPKLQSGSWKLALVSPCGGWWLCLTTSLCGNGGASWLGGVQDGGGMCGAAEVGVSGTGPDC